MSDTSEGKRCDCGAKLGLINLVLNVVILAILLIHFVGGRHHHFFCHHGGPDGKGCPAFAERHGPGPGPGGPGFGPMHGPGPGPGFGHGPEALNPDAVLDHLTRLLSLTDDQKTKLRPIVADAVTALEKNRTEKHEAAKKIIEGAKAKALPLLTPEQKKILDTLPRPPGPGGPRP
ncbi:MAG: hypothetical protein PW734_11470 [Verrucomicrobium sp.]|nr:hypothetical protein [Verrucomicrobium sp.]